MIKSPFINPAAFVGVFAAVAAACSPAETTSPAGVEVTYLAEETAADACEPRRIARVNKEEIALRALYGKVRFIDTVGGQRTKLPFQFAFSGWDENGISEDEVQIGLNTESPCSDIEIVVSVDYCFMDDTGRERVACPELLLRGDGFAGITLKSDGSQRYAEDKGRP